MKNLFTLLLLCAPLAVNAQLDPTKPAIKIDNRFIEPYIPWQPCPMGKCVDPYIILTDIVGNTDTRLKSTYGNPKHREDFGPATGTNICCIGTPYPDRLIEIYQDINSPVTTVNQGWYFWEWQFHVGGRDYSSWNLRDRTGELHLGDNVRLIGTVGWIGDADTIYIGAYSTWRMSYLVMDTLTENQPTYKMPVFVMSPWGSHLQVSYGPGNLPVDYTLKQKSGLTSNNRPFQIIGCTTNGIPPRSITPDKKPIIVYTRLSKPDEHVIVTIADGRTVYDGPRAGFAQQPFTIYIMRHENGDIERLPVIAQ